jgi:thioredoxin 1
MTQALEKLTGSTIHEEIAASVMPMLVEVGAEWCPPCRVMTAILKIVAAEQADRLRVFTVDADAHPDVSVRYAIRSLPTMLVFRDGALVGRLVGARPKAHLVRELADLLR